MNTPAPSPNMIRIALGIMDDMNSGVTLAGAVRTASDLLGVSPGAVCHALTTVQDYMSDTATDASDLLKLAA